MGASYNHASGTGGRDHSDLFQSNGQWSSSSRLCAHHGDAGGIMGSNLKHEMLLADTLVGQEIDSFPASLPYWKLARILDFLLLGFILVYQAHIFRAAEKIARAVWYPVQRLALLDWRPAAIAFVLPLALWMKTPTLNPIVLHPLWRKVGMVVTARRIIVGLVAWLIAWFVLRAIWNWRVNSVAGRSEGRTRLPETLYTQRRRGDLGGFRVAHQVWRPSLVCGYLPNGAVI